MSTNDRGISLRDEDQVVGQSVDAAVSSSALERERAADREAERESLGELFAAASRDFSELMRKEVELAKVELKEEAATAGRAGALLGAGGLVGYLALLIVLLAAAWLLGEVMPIWAGLLIVGIVAGIVAAVLLVMGRKKLEDLTPPVPQTVETIQEDVQWAKQQMS